MSAPVGRLIYMGTRDKVDDVLWESFPEVYRHSKRRYFRGFPFMPRTPPWKRFVKNQELGPWLRRLEAKRAK